MTSLIFGQPIATLLIGGLTALERVFVALPGRREDAERHGGAVKCTKRS